MSQYRIEELEILGLLMVDRSANPAVAMRVHLEFDTRSGALTVTWEHNHENGVAPAVYHGFVRRWQVPATCDGEALTQGINDGQLDALLDRIRDGASRHYDGNNYDCRLSPDAEAAGENVQEWIAELPYLPDNGGLWEAGDWLEGSPPSVAADATDADLDALVDQLEAEARSEYVALARTREYLQQLRDAARSVNRT